MASITSVTGFNAGNFNLSKVTAGLLEQRLVNEPITIDDATYSGYVDCSYIFEGHIYVLRLAGNSLSIAANNAVSGDIRGLLDYTQDGATLSLNWSIEEIFVSGIWGDMLTPETADETATLGASLVGADYFHGSASGDTFDGHSGIDTMAGRGGDDVLIGGLGADFMLGGEGDDTYHVDDTFDLVDEDMVFAGYGHGGIDTIVSHANWYWDAYSIAERMIIADDASDPSGAGTTIVGSAFSNEMIGNWHNNVLFGRGGSDTYRAGDGVDYISLSTLGLTDENAYTGVDGANTIVVEKSQIGPSYDVIFEFESGKDKVDVSDYGYETVDAILANGVDDGLGNSYFALNGQFSFFSDYVYFVGLTKAQISADDFAI